MPRTYLDILLEVKEDLRISRDQTLSLSVLNDAFRWFWDFYDWKDTIGDMQPFYLVPGWNIYRPPLVEKPSDFRDLFEAFYVTVNGQGSQSEKPLEVIGNIRPHTVFGTPNSIGYDKNYDAFLVNSNPQGVLGMSYIRPRYKKTYPVDLTAANAADNNFPLLHLEGPFKVVLGWFIRRQNKDDMSLVDQAMAYAIKADNPGRQAQAQQPHGLFGNVGL